MSATMSRPNTVDPLFLLLRGKRVEYCLPFILGIWLDSLALGLLYVAFGSWMKAVRATDRRVVRYLVIYLMAISTISSGFMVAQWVRVYLLGFGDFIALTNTTSECVPQAACCPTAVLASAVELTSSPAIRPRLLCPVPRARRILLCHASVQPSAETKVAANRPGAALVSCARLV